MKQGMYALLFVATLCTTTLTDSAFGQGPCGDKAAGGCCHVGGNGTPGCDDADCCESVCAIDPFCCDTSWDGICADEAAADPNCECPACGGDLSDDGVVNAKDLAELLGGWGPCDEGLDCDEDINGDGVVDAVDLAILLGNWGPCEV